MGITLRGTKKSYLEFIMIEYNDYDGLKDLKLKLLACRRALLSCDTEEEKLELESIEHSLESELLDEAEEIVCPSGGYTDEERDGGLRREDLNFQFNDLRVKKLIDMTPLYKSKKYVAGVH